MDGIGLPPCSTPRICCPTSRFQINELRVMGIRRISYLFRFDAWLLTHSITLPLVCRVSRSEADPAYPHHVMQCGFRSMGAGGRMKPCCSGTQRFRSRSVPEQKTAGKVAEAPAAKQGVVVPESILALKSPIFNPAKGFRHVSPSPRVHLRSLTRMPRPKQHGSNECPPTPW